MSEGPVDADDARERSESDADADAANPTNDADTGGDAADPPSDDWRAVLAKAGTLTPDGVSAIVSEHGDRGLQAIEAVSESRVKQYRDFTVVVGFSDEYVVEDGGCTCKDRAYNLDHDNPEARCWHAIAVDVARALDRVDHHDMWYSDVREFL